MSIALPKPGTYTAKPNGPIRLGDVKGKDGEFLVAEIPYKLVDSDVQYSGKHMAFLIKPDGTVYQRTCQDLMAIFGVAEIPDLADLTPDSNLTFTLSNCVHEDYQDKESGETRTRFKSGFINTVGGPSAVDNMTAADVKKKYGTKFKALFKTASKPAAKKSDADDQVPGAEMPPATPPATAPAAEPANPKAAVAGPRRAPAAPAPAKAWKDMNEVFAALQKANPGKTEEEYNALYFAATDKVCGEGVDPTTPEQIAAVAAELKL